MAAIIATAAGDGDRPDDGRRKKADRFFRQAEAVAAMGQVEYAIEMYISGLMLDPDDLEHHKTLRQLSLKRKISGGKEMGMFDKRKYPTNTHDPQQNMLNAARLLAYSPGNRQYIMEIFDAASRCGFSRVEHWAADLLRNSDIFDEN